MIIRRIYRHDGTFVGTVTKERPFEYNLLVRDGYALSPETEALGWRMTREMSDREQEAHFRDAEIRGVTCSKSS